MPHATAAPRLQGLTESEAYKKYFAPLVSFPGLQRQTGRPLLDSTLTKPGPGRVHAIFN